MTGSDARPVVRRMRPEEAGLVGAITVRAYAPFTDGPDDPYLVSLRDAALRDREAEVWVAVDPGVDDDVVLGSVTLCPPGSPWCEVAGAGEGEFRMLAVDPKAQGRGAGRALVDHVLQRFRDDGLHTVVISSLPEMTTAHRMYRTMGFARVPGRDHTPLPGVDLWTFARPLDGAGTDAISATHPRLGD